MSTNVPVWHNPENVPADKVPKGWRFPRSVEEARSRSHEGKVWSWTKTGFDTFKPGDHRGDQFDEAWTYVIPAEPDAAPASGWVSTKDRLPTEADADEDGYVWGWRGDNAFPAWKNAWSNFGLDTDWLWSPRIKQVAPPLPEPVKPTQEQEDEAFIRAHIESLRKTGMMYEWSPETIAESAIRETLRAERARGGKGAV